MSKETIENLAKALAESVPEGLRSMRADLEKNFRSVLQNGLDKLDLVTREEFEVQRAVLAKTREKLDGLEKKLAGLEKGSKTAKKSSRKEPAKKKSAKKKTGGKSKKKAAGKNH